MHYQTNNVLTAEKYDFRGFTPRRTPVLEPNGLVSLLWEKCPSFAEFIDLEEGPYSVLGDFAIHLRDGITNDTLSVDEVDNAFRFLNTMGDSDNSEIQNQLVVGVLEILADTGKSCSVANLKLRGRALALFERTRSGWS
uniref:Uncharacterized protein n=1 Tax=Candidatus Kentrum sp. SD TaxID=2126332 RepID=A0A451BM89_9GAMM|nr:MAG: hypothetical protein BECKSD772D_GA0070982_104711 [Candidatus Kentron sp. SD]